MPYFAGGTRPHQRQCLSEGIEKRRVGSEGSKAAAQEYLLVEVSEGKEKETSEIAIQPLNKNVKCNKNVIKTTKITFKVKVTLATLRKSKSPLAESAAH